jgi:hypothetical protein
MSHLSRTKTQGGDRFYKNRLVLAQSSILEAGWSETPAQKLLVWTWTSHEIFIKILLFYQKLFYFFLGVLQTQRCTPSHPYADGWKFLMPLMKPFTSPRSPRSLHSWSHNILFYLKQCCGTTLSSMQALSSSASSSLPCRRRFKTFLFRRKRSGQISLLWPLPSLALPFGWAREPALEGSCLKVLYSGRLWPHLEILDKAGKVWDKHDSLFCLFAKWRRKKKKVSYNIVTWVKSHKKLQM